MDQQETWIQLRMEPLPNNEEATAIGTIRDVTDEVKERHRREDAAKLLDRMTEGTIAGLEIGLETDSFRRSGHPGLPGHAEGHGEEVGQGSAVLQCLHP